ncbi:hypothetical protein HZB89_01705 [archaeon]|nr:hypothetical protein [archaeon]
MAKAVVAELIDPWTLKFSEPLKATALKGLHVKLKPHLYSKKKSIAVKTLGAVKVSDEITDKIIESTELGE